MYTMSETPSRYEDLVNILPKTRYVHIESPSGYVENEDTPQRAPPGTKVFGHPQLLTRKVVYIFNARPSHMYTLLNRYRMFGSRAVKPCYARANPACHLTPYHIAPLSEHDTNRITASYTACITTTSSNTTQHYFSTPRRKSTCYALQENITNCSPI